MRKTLIAALALTLAACGNGADEASSEAPAMAQAPQPGTYELVNTDGTVFVTDLRDDGGFTTYRGDEIIETGSWTWKDGAICYDGDGEGQNEACWTPRDWDGEGGYTATREDGQTVTVKRVS